MIVFYCRKCANKNRECNKCQWTGETAYPTFFAERLKLDVEINNVVVNMPPLSNEIYIMKKKQRDDEADLSVVDGANTIGLDAGRQDAPVILLTGESGEYVGSSPTRPIKNIDKKGMWRIVEHSSITKEEGDAYIG